VTGCYPVDAIRLPVAVVAGVTRDGTRQVVFGRCPALHRPSFLLTYADFRPIFEVDRRDRPSSPGEGMALFTELPSREIPGTSRAEGSQKLAPLVATRTYNKYGTT
jgi:hypothetical protein